MLTYNHQDFGPDSLLARLSDHEVVLTRPLRATLERLNPGMPELADEDALRQLTTTLPSQGIVATNPDKHALIRNGLRVAFHNAKPLAPRKHQPSRGHQVTLGLAAGIVGEARLERLRWSRVTRLQTPTVSADDRNNRIPIPAAAAIPLADETPPWHLWPVRR